jgi:hypothetical protein
VTGWSVLATLEPVTILIAAGVVGQVGTWREVRAGRVSIWIGMGVTMGALGLFSLFTGRQHLSPKVSIPTSVVVGLGSGLVLYLATRVFVAIASAWERFRRQTVAIYGNRDQVALPVALGVAVGLSVPGEELFWRGLVGGRFGEAVGSAVLGAAIALAGSVLFVWTGGVLSPICSHAVFTGLMILAPPPAALEHAIDLTPKPGPIGGPG